VGNITGTLLAVILSGLCDVHYVHRVDGQEFAFHTADIRAELEEIPLTHPAVRRWLEGFIAAGEEGLVAPPAMQAAQARHRDDQGGSVVLRFFLADLHIHTVLSACAEAEMLPEFILERAQQLGLRLIAVTDHNSAENVAAMLTAAEGTGITVFPGIEVETREEVHLLCLFDTLEQVTRWQEQVYARLPPLKNRDDVFGVQVVLDADGDAVGYNQRLLLTSTSSSVEEVVQRVRDLNGLCIPAHVDRPSYSVIANLGFIPPDLGIIGVEVSRLVAPTEARARFPELEQYSLIANSDAHRLQDMAARTTLKMAAATIGELSLALAGEEGRGVWVDGVCSMRCA
jgi:hypothetical protein